MLAGPAEEETATMNGDTLKTIEAILLGEEGIPERVSNRMLLLGLRVNHQLTTEALDCVKANRERIEAIEKRELIQSNKIDDVKQDSARYDKLIAAIAVAITAIGAFFSNR